jgi:hypothetical protein
MTSRYGLGVSARVALHGGRMRIVCSIDESTAARDAAETAGPLARRMRAELVYVHSVTGEWSERLGARSHRRCDLLIVGYTPRARFASALLGEAHRRLVRQAACPVMLVPAGARLRAGTGTVLGYTLRSIRAWPRWQRAAWLLRSTRCSWSRTWRPPGRLAEQRAGSSTTRLDASPRRPWPPPARSSRWNTWDARAVRPSNWPFSRRGTKPP